MSLTNEFDGAQKHQSLESYHEGLDLQILFTEDPEQVRSALDLEQRIWDENDFGSLNEYRVYDDQSRVYAAFQGDECVGVSRLFAGNPELPPFASLPITDESDKEMIIKECAAGNMEELGTAAVDHKASNAPKHLIALDMWRLAYRDSRNRGIGYWGIIMEPERVEKMNTQFNFTFKQLGPAVDYQGGACASFIMDLEEVDTRMSESMPELYDWFVNQPLAQKEL